MQQSVSSDRTFFNNIFADQIAEIIVEYASIQVFSHYGNLTNEMQKKVDNAPRDLIALYASYVDGKSEYEAKELMNELDKKTVKIVKNVCLVMGEA